MNKAKLAVLACFFFLLLLFAHFETRFFVSSVHAILRSGPWMALLIFAHNSLAASVVAVGMLLHTHVTEALPERFNRHDVVLRHPKLFSAVFSALLILGSVCSYGGLGSLNVSLIPLLLPVAVVESYGLFIASLTGLEKRVSARNMAKVYAVFAIGAVLETCLILFI